MKLPSDLQGGLLIFGLAMAMFFVMKNVRAFRTTIINRSNQPVVVTGSKGNWNAETASQYCKTYGGIWNPGYYNAALRSNGCCDIDPKAYFPNVTLRC